MDEKKVDAARVAELVEKGAAKAVKAERKRVLALVKDRATQAAELEAPARREVKQALRDVVAGVKAA